MIKFLFFALLILPLQALALPQAAPVPGGVAIIPLQVDDSDGVPQVYYNDARALVVRDGGRWLAVVGIPLSVEPGEKIIQLHINGNTLAQTFNVYDKPYATQHLTLKENDFVPIDVAPERSLAEVEAPPFVDSDLEDVDP